MGVIFDHKQAIEELRPLHNLMKEANNHSIAARAHGYGVRFGVRSSLPNEEAIEISLETFQGDTLCKTYKVISPKVLQSLCTKMTKEVDQLSNGPLIVRVTAQRPNGVDLLFIESVHCILKDPQGYNTTLGLPWDAK